MSPSQRGDFIGAMQSEFKPTKLESRYQFHSLLGEGGAGEVFAAWDDHLKRTVAIKRIKPHGLDDSKLVNPWSEAIRLASIRHANIVTVYDMGKDNDIPYIVMEHVQGETIDERVASQGSFGLEDFVELARQSLEGLLAAHHAGLIHRDLKPSNIMLTPLPNVAFRVKILDFGMAKFLSTPSAQTMDIDGSIIGSIPWISPEQLSAKAVDARSDLYSLGCVFYYALSGKEPYAGSNTMEVIAAHLSHDVIHLEKHRPDISPMLAQWVMALINLEPADRYQSAMQALNALNGIVNYTQSLPTAVSHTTGIITPAVALPSVEDVMPNGNAAGGGTGTPSGQVQEGSTPGANAPRGQAPTAATPSPSSQTVATSEASAANEATQKQGKREGNVLMIAVVLLILLLAGAVADLFFFRHSSNSLENTAPQPVSAAPAVPVEVAAAPSAHLPGSTPAPAPINTPAPQPAATPFGAATQAASAGASGGTEAVPAVALVPAVPAEVILRIHGSNTIGAKLLPALMTEFLKSQGAKGISPKTGADPEEVTLEADLGKGKKAIEIHAHGSSTAFEGLQGGKCEIGMASRQIKPEEANAIARAGLGELHSASFEHVLGLDGIAMLVNKDNPVGSLTKQDLAGIFSGKVTDWTQVGGQPGPIHVYARDAKSGTFDTFKSLVLEKLALVANAKRFEDSNELSDAVAADPAGIGFVGLPFIGDAKALAVSEPGTSPFIASRFTVATEDYLLSRRLYLYTTSASRNNPLVKKFLEFALSDEGQAVVQNLGFVKQTLDLQRLAPPPGAPSDYLTATKDAERLSLNLRFRPGSTQLDNKAIRDLDRIINMLAQPRLQGKTLLLLGFADTNGPENVNWRLSKERAQLVSKELVLRGFTAVNVLGLGSALPVASNESEVGREKNRRVEVWVK